MNTTLVDSDQRREAESVDLPVGAPRTENRAPIVAHVTRDVLYTRNVYKITYKCAKCGHSWTESKVSLSKD